MIRSGIAKLSFSFSWSTRFNFCASSDALSPICPTGLRLLSRFWLSLSTYNVDWKSIDFINQFGENFVLYRVISYKKWTFSTLTTFKCSVCGIKCIHIVVQPPVSPISRLQNFVVFPNQTPYPWNGKPHVLLPLAPGSHATFGLYEFDSSRYFI